MSDDPDVQQPPEDQGDAERPFGGEIPTGGGPPARALRWIAYALFVWAIGYLLVHPPIPQGRAIVLVFAGLLGGWFAFIALTRRPVDP